ncbi:MAG TPA: hypothetical protein VGK25_11395 [Ignavibacteria bacterium]|jgi:hypothetical protein
MVLANSPQEEYPILPYPDIPYNPGTSPREVSTAYGTFLVTPNVRVHPINLGYQVEVDIKTHPLNPDIMWHPFLPRMPFPFNFMS